MLGFLKTERETGVRKELIKLLGILGALDPYKYKLNQAPIRDVEANIDTSINNEYGYGIYLYMHTYIHTYIQMNMKLKYVSII